VSRKKKNNIVLEKILVMDYAAEGKSLAKVDGKVIFIENVVPGDVVDVQLSKNKKDWAEGWPLRFHSLSAERVDPFCSHFGVCGGCQWQMLPYQKQLEYKFRQVKDNLQRIGKIVLPEMMPILGAADTRFYRNKIEYTFGTKEFLPAAEFKKQKQLAESFLPVDATATAINGAVGFHAKGMFDKIVNIDTCYLQAEPTNKIRNAIKEFARQQQYSFYDIRNHHGLLRTMLIRLCTTGELMVNIVFGENDEKKINDLLKYIRTQFPSITTLLYTINTKMNDSLHDLEPVVYDGKGYVIEKLSEGHGGKEFQFKVGPKSFFQTNTRQAEQLYRVTKDFAALTGTETVYDLYCGTGSIGIFLSGRAKKIVGVEMIPAAISDAKENAALNSLNSTSFFAGDVIDICNDDFFAAYGSADVIVTDPPRAGMHEKLTRKILDIAAPVVVYVSCNPATQARDLAILDEKYSVTAIQPVDMFPHTLHIENVVQLKLK
jgi:23S rRNA (uracil1939-C5)-methyltransferase